MWLSLSIDILNLRVLLKVSANIALLVSQYNESAWYGNHDLPVFSKALTLTDFR